MSEYYAKLTVIRTGRALADSLSVQALLTLDRHNMPWPISGDHLTRALNSKDPS